MKRKILYSLFFISVLLIYFFTLNFFNSPKSISTFKQYSSRNYKLDKEIINTYLSDEYNNTEIERNIKKILLNNLGYEQWQEYIDYIELQIYIDNVIPNNSPPLIAVLNLSKDLATIIILDEVNGEYIYRDRLENISKVKEIKFLENNIFDRNIMLIYQQIDEYFGAFFYKEFLEIYVYTNNSFTNLWEHTIYFEETYKESWLHPQDTSNKWNRVLEITQIEFDLVNSLEINSYTEQFKYIAYSESQPVKDEYILKNKYDFKQSFYWADKYNRFVIGEVAKDTFLMDVAILKDMNNSIEKLFGIENSNLKVISQRGEIIYLNKDKFGTLFTNTK